MSEFKVFIAHCDRYPNRPIVSQLYQLLADAFEHEMRSGAFQIFYDGDDPIPPGNDLPPSLAARIAECDLVLACSFRRWRDAKYFQAELKAAKTAKIPVIPVLFRRPTDTNEALGVGQLFKKTQVSIAIDLDQILPARPKNPDPNPDDVRERLKNAFGSGLGGELIRTLRSALVDRARRDLSMFDNSNQLFANIATEMNGCLKMFMFDGGTTIRRLASDPQVTDRLRQLGNGLSVEFLYVNTAFRAFIQNTKEYRQARQLANVPETCYAPLYEGLLRRSGVVHNESPNGHAADVVRSVDTLTQLAAKCGFRLEIRNTSQLPFFRVILTGPYVYYTHFVPTFSETEKEINSPDFYSLRLSARSPAGSALSKSYEQLWSNAKSHAPQQTTSTKRRKPP